MLVGIGSPLVYPGGTEVLLGLGLPDPGSGVGDELAGVGVGVMLDRVGVDVGVGVGLTVFLVLLGAGVAYPVFGWFCSGGLGVDVYTGMLLGRPGGRSVLVPWYLMLFGGVTVWVIWAAGASLYSMVRPIPTARTPDATMASAAYENHFGGLGRFMIPPWGSAGRSLSMPGTVPAPDHAGPPRQDRVHPALLGLRPADRSSPVRRR